MSGGGNGPTIVPQDQRRRRGGDRAGGDPGVGRAPAYAQGHEAPPPPLERLRARRRTRCWPSRCPRPRRPSGAEVTLERINANDLQPRITAAISVGQPAPDIIHLPENWPHLYAKSLVDVATSPRRSARRRAASTTAMTSSPRSAGRLAGRAPRVVGGQIAYRKSLFAEVGAKEFPKTWQAYREVGKKLKAKGFPIGQTAGHTFGDAPGVLVPVHVGVGRQGSRDGRQGRHQLEGDRRVREVRRRLLEGRLRRGRAGLGRLQQQPGLPLRHHRAPPSTARRSTSSRSGTRRSTRPTRAR